MITLLIFATKIKNRFSKEIVMKKIYLGGIISGIAIVSGILFLTGIQGSGQEIAQPIIEATRDNIGTKIALSESMSMGNP